MPRKPTSKRLRFEVFERDAYICRYCGAQPPAVVLVIDHLLPVTAGGETNLDNLVTACESCNQGKAGRVLGSFPPTPDLDMRYLQLMQEAGELSRYRAALNAREAQIEALVTELQSIWTVTGGLDWHPADHIVRQMLARYAPETVEAAFRDVGHKVGSGYIERNRWVQYLWAVMRNMEEESAG